MSSAITRKIIFKPITRGSGAQRPFPPSNMAWHGSVKVHVGSDHGSVWLKSQGWLNWVHHGSNQGLSRVNAGSWLGRPGRLVAHAIGVQACRGSCRLCGMTDK